ncbi:MAG: acyl carrier protein [Lachnospiraceae bacterium]|nr:acyl carrier protein [Lachnospiraceae bacterium]
MEQLLTILKGIRNDVDFEKEEFLIDGNVLDSFDIVTIVNGMEETFGIEIKASDIIPENFNSVSAMTALVEKYRNA